MWVWRYLSLLPCQVLVIKPQHTKTGSGLLYSENTNTLHYITTSLKPVGLLTDLHTLCRSHHHRPPYSSVFIRVSSGADVASVTQDFTKRCHCKWPELRAVVQSCVSHAHFTRGTFWHTLFSWQARVCLHARLHVCLHLLPLLTQQTC